LLIEKWAAAGHLPFFRQLLAECPLVRLSALSRILQGALWPSVLTGVSPAHHGRYSFSQLVPGTYHFDSVRSNELTAPRFYAVLGSHGIRCASIDVPSDLAQPTFPGIQVVDWGTEFGLGDFVTQPRELKEQIITRYGRHYLSGHPSSGETVMDHRMLLENLMVGVRQKSALIRDVLNRRARRQDVFVDARTDQSIPLGPVGACQARTALREHQGLAVLSFCCGPRPSVERQDVGHAGPLGGRSLDRGFP
jgi:predicted AlkP superfamily phosphohydrolase/phosphomutase